MQIHPAVRAMESRAMVASELREHRADPLDAAPARPEPLTALVVNNTMKPEEQNKAIAEACGASFWMVHVGSAPFLEVRWKDKPMGLSAGYAAASREIEPWELLKTPLHGYIPDYLSDLNAMVSALDALPYEKQAIYMHILCFKVMMKSEGVSDYEKHTATAAQRAEAFLRTLNIWTE